MPTDQSLETLREANPRRHAQFEESIAHHDALRTQITTTPIPTRRRFPRLSSRRGVVGLSAAAAVALSLGGVLVAVMLSATSPPSAYAAARKALAATAAASSGTMTLTVVHDANTWTLDTTRWHGADIAMSAGPGIHGYLLIGPNRQLRLIEGGVYVQKADGSWVRYSSASAVGPKLGPALQLAHDNVAGSTAEQILALATGLRKVIKPDGTTIYTGTIHHSNDTAVAPTDDTIMRMIINLRNGDRPGAPNRYRGSLHLMLLVNRNGLATQVSLAHFQQHGARTSAYAGTWTSNVTYSQLGSAPPVTAPASFSQDPGHIQNRRH